VGTVLSIYSRPCQPGLLFNSPLPNAVDFVHMVKKLELLIKQI
jgi:hypothetical protein